MPIFSPVWAVDGPTDVPSELEVRTGFKCGRVTNARMNYIIQSIEAAINSLDLENPVPAERRVDASNGIGGGGDLSQNRSLYLNIFGLPTVASIANDDWLAIYDVSGSANGKITRENLIAGLGGEGGAISGGTNIGDGGGQIFSSVDGSSLEFRTIDVAAGLSVVTAGDKVTIGFANLPSELTSQ